MFLKQRTFMVCGFVDLETGVRAPLYWFHEQGFFEEFLGDKKGRVKQLWVRIPSLVISGSIPD